MATLRHNILRRMTSVVKSAKPWLCFTAEEANSTIRLDKVGSPDAVSLETSQDGKTWAAYTWSGNTGATITLASVGAKVYWRATSTNSTFSSTGFNYYQFKPGTGTKCRCEGSLLSLLEKNCEVNFIPTYCFYYLLGGYSYLTETPTLPEVEANNASMYRIFEGQTVNSGRVVIPKMKLTGNALRQVYKDNGISEVVIKADTIYSNTTLSYIFQNCSSLNRIEVAFKQWPTNGITSWVDGVAASGTFVCPDELDTSVRGVNYIPEGWTIVRQHQRYVQDGLVYQLDCRVGLSYDATKMKGRNSWQSVVGNVTLRDADFNAQEVQRDSKGGVIPFSVNGFSAYADLLWSIEEGYTVEICGGSTSWTDSGVNYTGVHAIFEHVEFDENQRLKRDSLIAAVLRTNPTDPDSASVGVAGIVGFPFGNTAKECPTLNSAVFSLSCNKDYNEINGVAVTGPAITSPPVPQISEANGFLAVLSHSPIYSIRVYNRALTADERARNRQIDKERFG